MDLVKGHTSEDHEYEHLLRVHIRGLLSEYVARHLSVDYCPYIETVTAKVRIN